MHTLEIPQTKNRKSPYHGIKELLMELKVIQTTASLLIQPLRKNTGLSMILENGDYWASCKATLIPCFVKLELTRTLSHLPVDTVFGGTGRTLQVERGLGLLFQSLPLVLPPSHYQHVRKPWCTFSSCAGPGETFPRALPPQPMPS